MMADLSYAGKILVVDDRYDEAVEKAVTTLVQRGMLVQYWDGKGDFPETIRNVRVVILDLDLAGLGSRSPGPEFYSLAAQALNKIPGPFVVVIMALDFNDKDPSNLKETYQNIYGAPFPGFVAQEGLTKTSELHDTEGAKRLAELITGAISGNSILDLILLWEVVLDRAKDQALRDLVKVEFENTIIALIQSICKELGEESAALQLVDIVMTLVSRNVRGGKEFEKLDNLIRTLNKSPPPTKRDSFLYHRLKFYHPTQEESHWTGDIYRTTNERKYDQYAIVLTPACDLAQRKAKSVLVCFAFPLKEECLVDKEYPPYVVDDFVAKKLASASIFEAAQLVRQRYFDFDSTNLPMRMHRVPHFADNTNDEPFGICFDFSNVRSLPVDDLKKWQRICRLDSPFIEDMLQKYGSHAFRIGIPDWK